MTKVGRYFITLLSAVSRSALLPVRLRVPLLRRLGWKIGQSAYVCSGSFSVTNNVVLADGVWIGYFVFFDDWAGVSVGEYARIGPFCRFITRTHPIEPNVVRRVLGHDIDQTVTVGRGCWLGTGVTVLPGVAIAEGCVIGAGSLVTQSTMPNGLYIGVPARRVRDLPVNDPSLQLQA